MLRSPHRALVALCLGVLVAALPACDSADDSDPVDTGLLDTALANPDQWYFIETPEAECRDGSPTGFGVRLQEGATDLVIYLEGGGACFNASTCETNPSSFGATEFATLAALRGEAGIFSTDASNPVGDWNAVYVPYCTGDVHGGSAPDRELQEAGGPQQFVGHLNIERYLEVLEPVLGDADRVLLTGASAGGFGTLVNFPAVAETFDDAELFMLNDSGPMFFADDVLSPQLGAVFSALYLLPRSLSDTAADDLFETDGLQGIYDYYGTEYPDVTFGLASYTQDQTIRRFFGFGQPDGMISGEEYEAGLLDVRDRLPNNWGTYFVDGETHTFIGSSDTYIPLSSWLADLLAGNPTDVGP